MHNKIKISHLVSVGLLMACTSTKNDSEPSSPEPPSSDRTLFDYMNNLRADYVPLSAKEMVDDSDVIARGHITAVRDGRVVDNANGPSLPIRMAVVEITVTEVVKGQEDDAVYFEHIRGGSSPEEMAEHLPVEEVLVFLIPPRWDTTTHKFEYQDRGLPAGEQLYVLRTQQALLMEADGVVVQPLEHGPPGSDAQMFDSTSLNDVDAQVRALMTSATGDNGQQP